MKAMILKTNGGPENLVLSEVAEPVIKPDEYLVKVKAISVNPVDAAVRQNKQVMMKIMQLEKEFENHILGWDISGTIVRAGKEAENLQGNDVFGMVNFPGQGKAYAEYVAAPVNQLAIKPGNISHPEAAGATLAALTAWQALVTYGRIKEGDKVLVHAAAGGVGHFAVQIAKSFGAYVIGTASAYNRDFVFSLGADEFIDYTQKQFEEKIKDADLVMDSINNRDHLGRSIDACKKGGRLISIKYYFDDELNARARAKDLHTDRILVASNGDDMERIAALLAKGVIKTHVSETYSFADLPKAHQQIETGKTRGKIIITL